MPPSNLPYLQGYPEALQAQIEQHLQSGELKRSLSQRYPGQTLVKTDRQLRQYVMELKNRFLKRSAPLNKICFDDKITQEQGAFGLHTYAGRVQGARTKTKNELRIASLFKNLPDAFLRMVVVHELAHLKEKEHNKAFYKLCCLMEPDYRQLEFDLRLFLTARDYRPLGE